MSKGIDRDRAVDESGNQLAVFGRRGARPFNRQEMERMYLHDGEVFTVTDETPTTSSAPEVRDGCTDDSRSAGSVINPAGRDFGVLRAVAES